MENKTNGDKMTPVDNTKMLTKELDNNEMSTKTLSTAEKQEVIKTGILDGFRVSKEYIEELKKSLQVETLSVEELETARDECIKDNCPDYAKTYEEIIKYALPLEKALADNTILQSDEIILKVANGHLRSELKRAYKTIDNLQNDEWVKTSDRLPEIDVEVFAEQNYGNVFWVATYDGKHWRNMVDEIIFIKAWKLTPPQDKDIKEIE
jgi:hypothetical protein